MDFYFLQSVQVNFTIGEKILSQNLEIIFLVLTVYFFVIHLQA